MALFNNHNFGSDKDSQLFLFTQIDTPLTADTDSLIVKVSTKAKRDLSFHFDIRTLQTAGGENYTFTFYGSDDETMAVKNKLVSYEIGGVIAGVRENASTLGGYDLPVQNVIGNRVYPYVVCSLTVSGTSPSIGLLALFQ